MHLDFSVLTITGLPQSLVHTVSEQTALGTSNNKPKRLTQQPGRPNLQINGLDRPIKSREKVINAKGAAAEAALSICLGQVGKRGPDALPHQEAIRNLQPPQPRLPGPNCLHAAGESTHYLHPAIAGLLH